MLPLRASQALAQLPSSQQRIAMWLLRRHQNPGTVPSAYTHATLTKQIEQLAAQLTPHSPTR